MNRGMPRANQKSLRYTAITVADCKFALQNASVPPRARGGANLLAKADARGTNIAGLRQSGSLKLLFPRKRTAALHAVAVNTAGGVTGGDVFALSIGAECGAELTLTTQAAERAYQAQPEERARIENRISLADGARVNWVPQETILYRGCAVDRTLSVDMATTASLLLAEPLVFGRAAMGETLTEASFRDRIEIRQNGKIVFLDAMTFSGDPAKHLGRTTIAGGAGAMVSLVFIATDAEAQLAPLRAMLSGTGGASLLRDDILFLRLLAADSFALRASLVPILNRLTGNDLPRTWMI